MSRDQRPGKVRIFADRPAPPPNRRRGDQMNMADSDRAAASSVAAVPQRHWLTIPAWLFAIGFVVGGLATAARNLIAWPTL